MKRWNKAELIDWSPFTKRLDVAYGLEASGTSSTCSGVHVLYSSLARLGTVIDFTTRASTTPEARRCCNSTFTTLAEKLLDQKYSSIADTDLARLP